MGRPSIFVIQPQAWPRSRTPAGGRLPQTAAPLLLRVVEQEEPHRAIEYLARLASHRPGPATGPRRFNLRLRTSRPLVDGAPTGHSVHEAARRHMHEPVLLCSAVRRRSMHAGGALAAVAVSSSSAESAAFMHVRPCTPAPESPPSSPGGSGSSGTTIPTLTEESSRDDPAARSHAFTLSPAVGAAANGAAQHASRMHTHSEAAQHSGPGPSMPAEWPCVQGMPTVARQEGLAAPHAGTCRSHVRPTHASHAYGLGRLSGPQPVGESSPHNRSMHGHRKGTNPVTGPNAQSPGHTELVYGVGRGAHSAATMHARPAAQHGGGPLSEYESLAALQPRHMSEAGGMPRPEGQHPVRESDTETTFSSARGGSGKPRRAWVQGSDPALAEPRYVDPGSVLPACVCAASVHTSHACSPRTEAGCGSPSRVSFGKGTFGRSLAQHQMRQWSSEDAQSSPSCTQRAQHAGGVQNATVEQTMMGRKQARGGIAGGGAGTSCNSCVATSAAAQPESDLLQQRVRRPTAMDMT